MFDRLETQDENGRDLKLADGGLVCNCPIVLAIMEAKRIWPDRPIGVVLSFGIDPSQDEFANRAVESLRLENPHGFHFHRIVPKDAIGEMSVIESHTAVVREFEKKVKDYVLNSDRERLRLDQTIKLLFKGPSRRIESKRLNLRSSRVSTRILKKGDLSKRWSKVNGFLKKQLTSKNLLVDTQDTQLSDIHNSSLL